MREDERFNFRQVVGELLELRICANPQCKKCYGRGFTGLKDEKPILCGCLETEAGKHGVRTIGELMEKKK